MADIPSTIKGIAQAQAGLKELSNSLDKINNIKASPTIDAAAFNEASKYAKLLEDLTETTTRLNDANEEFNKIQKENNDILKVNGKLTKEQIDNLQKASDKAAEIAKDQKKYADERSKAEQNATKTELAASEAKMDAWKKNTLLGKSHTALTSNIAKMTAGIGFAALGMKALNRFSDAARLRNSLMIASYGSLTDEYGKAASETLRYESAMRGASATAKYLGMSNEDTIGIMMKYQRIIGKASPEALEALTSATLATAKVMGIDSATAIAYVSAKMDNFGGTAEGALASLQELRGETQKYNTSLAGVSIRGDDVVKTIQDITNSNNVYAVDQRFLAQTLMRTSATLQANGESYNYAQKMANNYTKSLSSEAPEWMKITNSFDIAKEVGASWGKNKTTGVEELTSEMAAKLEKAKPGLSKKVSELMSNKQYSSYDKTRLLGEMLGDTQIGMTLMNKKIVDLGKSSISTLASVYGKSYMEAEEIYKAALKTQELEENTRILKGGTSEAEIKAQADLKKAMQEKLGLSKAGMALAMKDEESQRRALESYSGKVSMEKSSLAIAKQKKDATILQGKLEDNLALKKVVLANADTAGDKEQAQIAVEEAQKALDDAKAQAKKGEIDAKAGDLNKAKDMTKGAKGDQAPTALLTGDLFASKIEELSSPLGLLSVGALAFFATSAPMQILQTALLGKIAGTADMKGVLGSIAKAITGEGTIMGAARGALNAVPGAGLVNSVGSAAGLSSGAGLAATAGAGALVAGAGYAGWKIGGAINESKAGQAFSDFATSGATISDEEAFAMADAKMATKRKNRKPVVSGGIPSAPSAPSDKFREGLIKTTTDTSVQQAKVVQQALQATDTTGGPTPPTGVASSTTGGTGPGGAQGTFEMINPDGSVNLKINDFMNTFGTALAQAKTR